MNKNTAIKRLIAIAEFHCPDMDVSIIPTGQVGIIPTGCVGRVQIFDPKNDTKLLMELFRVYICYYKYDVQIDSENETEVFIMQAFNGEKCTCTTFEDAVIDAIYSMLGNAL